MSDFGAILSTLATWLLNLFTFFPKLIWDGVLVALGALISSIPVPSWLSSAAGYIQNIPPDVLYFLAPFDLPFGLSVVTSALLIRFLIRRIPFVGG